MTLDPLMQFYAIVVAGLVALGIGALIAKKIGF
jgi:hypothetical protein